MNTKMKNWHDHICPCLFYPAIVNKGYSIETVLSDAAKQADVLEWIPQEYQVPVVIRMAEIWAEAASFGMELTISERDFPKLGEAVYPDPEEWEDINTPEVRNIYTVPMIEAVRIASAKMECPIIAGVTGPYTLGSIICGSEEFMMNCMMDPELVEEVLEKVTDFLIGYALEYKAAGAAGIILAEPSVAMISPAMVDEFSNTCIKKIINAVQDDKFLVIYHNCGEVNKHLEVICKLPVDAFHFGSDVNLPDVFEKVTDSQLVMGNIDPRLFLGNNKTIIEEKLAEAVQMRHKYPQYVISTGCDLAPQADVGILKSYCKSM